MNQKALSTKQAAALAAAEQAQAELLERIWRDEESSTEPTAAEQLEAAELLLEAAESVAAAQRSYQLQNEYGNNLFTFQGEAAVLEYAAKVATWRRRSLTPEDHGYTVSLQQFVEARFGSG